MWTTDETTVDEHVPPLSTHTLSMPELSRLDKKVVKYWWGEAAISIFESGYILDKHIPSLRVSHLPETCRSFQEIVDSGAIIVRSRYSLSQYFPLSSCGSQRRPNAKSTGFL